jgi:hypothetical protein
MDKVTELTPFLPIVSMALAAVIKFFRFKFVEQKRNAGTVLPGPAFGVNVMEPVELE